MTPDADIPVNVGLHHHGDEPEVRDSGVNAAPVCIIKDLGTVVQN